MQLQVCLCAKRRRRDTLHSSASNFGRPHRVASKNAKPLARHSFFLRSEGEAHPTSPLPRAGPGARARRAMAPRSDASPLLPTSVERSDRRLSKGKSLLTLDKPADYLKEQANQKRQSTSWWSGAGSGAVGGMLIGIVLTQAVQHYVYGPIIPASQCCSCTPLPPPSPPFAPPPPPSPEPPPLPP